MRELSISFSYSDNTDMIALSRKYLLLLAISAIGTCTILSCGCSRGKPEKNKINYSGKSAVETNAFVGVNKMTHSQESALLQGLQNNTESSQSDLNRKIKSFSDSLSFLSATNDGVISLDTLTNQYTERELVGYLQQIFFKLPRTAKRLCEHLLESSTNANIILDTSGYYLEILTMCGTEQDIPKAYQVIDKLEHDYLALSDKRTSAETENYITAIYTYAITLSDQGKMSALADIIDQRGEMCLPLEVAYSDRIRASQCIFQIDVAGAKEHLEAIKQRGVYGKRNVTEAQVEQLLQYLNNTRLDILKADVMQSKVKLNKRIPYFGGIRRINNTK